jgi:hypothetical protein
MRNRRTYPTARDPNLEPGERTLTVTALLAAIKSATMRAR